MSTYFIANRVVSAQVEQVDEASGNAMAEATTAVVEAILEPLRPAMVAMRAKVEVRRPLV